MKPSGQLPPGVTLGGSRVAGSEEILTPDALEFLAQLHRAFEPVRTALLERRLERQAEIDAGASLGLLPNTAAVRADPNWRVAEAPPDLLDRRVEITGPAEPKMIINALNSGARAFMADFEDSLSPTWENVVGGQAALRDAVRGTLAFTSPEGKSYRLGDRPATLLVRPRGWHLPERHVRVDGQPISASLFDFGLYAFHNARERLRRGTGLYLYLPEAPVPRRGPPLERRLRPGPGRPGRPAGHRPGNRADRDDPRRVRDGGDPVRAAGALLRAQRRPLGLPVLVHQDVSRSRRRRSCPDRAQVTMSVPFMRAYTERLVMTCHRRGAHAMGGMAAFIPSRRDAAVNETAMAKVREDKQRESSDGFDGTWVAHPDLVPLATEVFDSVLGERPNQRDRRADEAPLGAEVPGDPAALLDLRVEGGG